MSQDRHAVIAYLQWVRSISDLTLKDFPADKYTFQTGPQDNHALWVLGHLAGGDCWLGSLVGAPGMPDIPDGQALFGMGSKPVPDASKYPPLEIVRKAYDQARDALIRWLETASPEALAADLKEKTGGFATDPLDGAMKMAWHEGWHLGQVATLRKALGLKPVF